MLIQDLAIIAKGAQSYIRAKRTTSLISGIEQTVCLHIFLHGQTNQEQLAKRLMMDKGNMAKTLAALENVGLVDRIENPHNRRENLVSITKRGEEILGPIIELCAEWEDSVLNDLSQEEATLFRKICNQIGQQADEWKEVDV